MIHLPVRAMRMAFLGLTCLASGFAAADTIHRSCQAPTLAASQLTFAARLTPADHSEVGIRTTTSLVWRCGTAGWKIAREHNSSVRVEANELRRLMGD
jgi:hypothetical protein